jgi:hypothetical protein
LLEPEYRPEDDAEPSSGGLLGWLSLGLGVFAIPGMAERSTLPLALAFAVGAIVVGMVGLSRKSAPFAAGVGLGLGIGAVLVVGLLFWFYSAMDDWEF